MRRAPRQQRARQTIEVVLTASAHILVRDGYERLTTNRVAQVAGVSIGSLYQYFPNKEALVAALYDRHLEKLIAVFRAQIETPRRQTLAEALEGLVAATIEIHTIEPELHAVLLEQTPRLACPRRRRDLDATILDQIQAYLGRFRAGIRPMDLGLATFVVVRAVEAVVHTATLQRWDPPRLKTLAGELTVLLRRYLEKRPETS